MPILSKGHFKVARQSYSCCYKRVQQLLHICSSLETSVGIVTLWSQVGRGTHSEMLSMLFLLLVLSASHYIKKHSEISSLSYYELLGIWSQWMCIRTRTGCRHICLLGGLWPANLAFYPQVLKFTGGFIWNCPRIRFHPLDPCNQLVSTVWTPILSWIRFQITSEVSFVAGIREYVK